MKAVDAGGSTLQVAARFDVSPSTVVKLMRRVWATGRVEPARIGGYRNPLLAAYEATIRDLVAAKREHHAIVARGGPAVSPWAVSSMLQRIGLRHKKKSLRAAEQDRPDVAKARRCESTWNKDPV